MQTAWQCLGQCKLPLLILLNFLVFVLSCFLIDLEGQGHWVKTQAAFWTFTFFQQGLVLTGCSIPELFIVSEQSLSL